MAKTGRMSTRRARALLVALTGAAVLGGCASGREEDTGIAGDTLTIYASQPLQGRLGAQAADVVRAERLALEQAGGRAGRFRIRFVALNSADPETGAWDPGMVSANARRGVQDERTIAYLGELETGASAVSIPILNEAGILAISPADTVAGFTRKRGAAPGEPDKYYPTRERNFARLVPPDDVQAAALVAYMRDSRVRRLFVVNDESQYGGALSLSVARAARRDGIEVLDEHGTHPARTDPRALAAEIAAARAEAVVYLGSPGPGVARLLAAVHRAAPRLKLFAPNALAQPDFLESLGPAAEMTFLTAPTLSPRQYPPSRVAFARRFRARYGHDPAPEAFFGYEAMSLALSAIAGAGADANDREQVIEAMFRTGRSRESIIGSYSIDPRGDTSVTVYGAYRVRRGRLAFERVLDPLGA